MSMNLERLRAKLREGLGNLDSVDLTDVEADELLNRSLWDLEDKFPFELKETVYSTTLVSGQYEYDLSSISTLDALHSVAVVDTNGKRNKLQRMTRAFFDETFDDDDVGLPTHYMREGDVLVVWPVPTSVEDGLQFDVTIKEELASLSNPADIPGMPRNWHELILLGGIYRGHIQRQDYSEAREALNFQQSLVRSTTTTEAKEEEDSRYAAVEVLWEWPDQ